MTMTTRALPLLLLVGGAPAWPVAPPRGRAPPPRGFLDGLLGTVEGLLSSDAVLPRDGDSPAMVALVDVFLEDASPGSRRALRSFLARRDRALSLDAFLEGDGDDAGGEVEALRLEWRAFRNVWRARVVSGSAAASWAQQDAFETYGDVYAIFPCEEDGLAECVRGGGVGNVAMLQGAVRPGAVQALRRHALAVRDAGDAGFGNILGPRDDTVAGAPQTRWDAFLDPRDDEVAAVVAELLRGPAGDALEDLCGGLDAPLRECAAIVATPGAAPQPIHADTTWTEAPVLFTCFVALQDIPPELGPTRFLPGTATKACHDALDDALVDEASPERAITDYCASRPSILALLEAGDATLYDSRLQHAGGPCVDGGDRALFYVSFGHAANEAYDAPPQRSLAPAVAKRGLTLGDLRRGAPAAS